MTNKDFWNLVKPALSEKDNFKCSNIIIEHKNELIKDDSELGEIFNDHYINIVENTTGTKPESIQIPGELTNENINQTINDIIEKYKDHPSILCINENKQNSNQLSLSLSNSSEINKLLKEINRKKQLALT